MFKYANPLPYNHGLLVCGISVNKDVLYEFHRLFKLQSRSCRMCGNEGYESLDHRHISVRHCLLSNHTLKSNSALGTHLHAMIRTHYFHFDIRF